MGDFYERLLWVISMGDFYMLTGALSRFEQLTLRANALREELHTEIEKILNDVIKFKVHIQQNLENYEAFVDQEVKTELDEGGAEDEGFAGVTGMDE